MSENAYILSAIPCRWKLHPGYMHTFGVTDTYFVIVEQPLSISVPEYVKAHLYNQNLSASLKWFQDKSTIFHLMDRKTGKVCNTIHSDSFFYLHIINQYEEDNHLVIDICCYKDPEMINCLFLEATACLRVHVSWKSVAFYIALREIILLINTNSTNYRVIFIQADLVNVFDRRVNSSSY